MAKNVSIESVEFSPAEMKVMALLCKGLSAPVIGEKLKISTENTNKHIYTARQKAGAKNSAHLAFMLGSAGMFSKTKKDANGKKD
jgi:DNA-binding CsgD family transcriptional regulator